MPRESCAYPMTGGSSSALNLTLAFTSSQAGRYFSFRKRSAIHSPRVGAVADHFMVFEIRVELLTRVLISNATRIDMTLRSA